MTALDTELSQALAEANRDVVGVLGREADRIARLHDRGVPADRLLRRAARVAQDGTRDLTAAADEVYEQWESTYRSQRAGWTADDQAAVCRGFAGWVEAVRVRVIAVRQLWGLVEMFGGTADGAADLTKAAGRLKLAALWIEQAAKSRQEPWEPRDKERFEQAMRRSGEGNIDYLTADEFKARMRRKPDEGAA